VAQSRALVNMLGLALPAVLRNNQHVCDFRFEVGIPVDSRCAREQLAMPVTALHALPDSVDDALGPCRTGGNALAQCGAQLSIDDRALVLGPGRSASSWRCRESRRRRSTSHGRSHGHSNSRDARFRRCLDRRGSPEPPWDRDRRHQLTDRTARALSS